MDRERVAAAAAAAAVEAVSIGPSRGDVARDEDACATRGEGACA